MEDNDARELVNELINIKDTIREGLEDIVKAIKDKE